MSRISRRVLACLLLVSLAAAGLMTPGQAAAYTPEHPEVQAMVQKGVAYLKKIGFPSELGGQCLVAMAIYKSGDKSDKRIAQAVATCRKACVSLPKKMEDKDVYSIGIALIFLVELDAHRHRNEIEILLKELVRRQRKDGSWSYPPRNYGDTSITQYGVLGLWAAKKTGFQVDKKIVDDCARWLIRTQDTTGAWSYIGEDPGNYTRINQRRKFDVYNGVSERVTGSMVVAGLGSLYMCADMLGYKVTGKPLAAERDLLEVIKLVSSRTDEDATASRIFGRAIPDGEKYYRANCRTRTDHWQYYYLYGMERYESFREEVLKIENEEPAWYNQGVEFLKTDQSADGSWIASRGPGPVNTAFATLFLLRSTRSILTKLVEGRLASGKGLPLDVDLWMNSKNRIVTNPLAKTMSQILTLLEEEQDSEEVKKLLSRQFDVSLEGDSATQAEQSARLRAFVTHDDWKRRLIAVQTISRTRDLDNAPALIFALTDGDKRVVKQARDGLRYISRRFHGFGLNDFSEGKHHPSEKQKEAAQENWKQWYLTVRPDRAVDFEEY